MKKLITVILTAVMLGACGGKAADPTPTPADAPTPAPAAVPTAKPASERPSGAGTAGSETPHPYVPGMEGYEDLEVAFLGTVNSERSRADVVARAAKEAVAYVASYDKGPYAHPGGLLGNYPEYGLVKEAFSLYTGHCTMVWFG